MKLASYKLRFADAHVRAVPKTGLDGCPFAGPGVDVLGDDARALLAEAEPLARVLREFEPGLVIRSVSVALDARRVLATFHVAGEPLARPRVVRLDAGAALERVLAASEALEPALGEAVSRALAARLTPRPGG